MLKSQMTLPSCLGACWLSKEPQDCTQATVINDTTKNDCCLFEKICTGYAKKTPTLDVFLNEFLVSSVT